MSDADKKSFWSKFNWFLPTSSYSHSYPFSIANEIIIWKTSLEVFTAAARRQTRKSIQTERGREWGEDYFVRPPRTYAPFAKTVKWRKHIFLIAKFIFLFKSSGYNLIVILCKFMCAKCKYQTVTVPIDCSFNIENAILSKMQFSLSN